MKGSRNPKYRKILRSSSGSEDGLRVSDIHARKNFLKTRRYWITWIVRNQAQTCSALHRRRPECAGILHKGLMSAGPILHTGKAQGLEV